MRPYLFQLLLFNLFFFLAGCKPQKELDIAIYDWEVNILWNEERNKYVRDLNVNQIYLKVLETDGVSSIRTTFQGQMSGEMEMVPVIRLNDTYFDNQSISIAAQSSHFIEEIKAFEERSNIHFGNEIQFDFDYVSENRERYFELLRSMKQLSTKNISITLNLEKVKDKIHLPPVSYCVVMLYDLPSQDLNVPAISDKKALDTYGQFVYSYPLPLHYAIASFARTFIRRNNEVFVIPNIDFEELKKDAHFVFSGDGKYEVVEAFDFHRHSLQKGDMLFTDISSIGNVNESINFVKENSNLKDDKIVFFSLNEAMMKRFSTQEINHSLEQLK